MADSLVAVVCQRLRYRSDLNLRVPECEILRPNNSVKTFVRNRDFFKLPQALETGAEYGMWSFERYQAWLSKRTQWHLPNPQDEAPDREEGGPGEDQTSGALSLKPAPNPLSPDLPSPVSPTEAKRPRGPIEIEPVEGGLDELIKRLT